MEGLLVLKKGVLIVVEGIDGAGKSTQVHLLEEYLSRLGLPTASVVRFKEPTNGVFGQKIRELAEHGRSGVDTMEEFQLFLHDRIEDVKQNIMPALEKRSVVIMDRYYFSNIAYQGARGLNVDYIKSENEKIAPIPDFLLIIDILPEIGISRIRDLRGDTPNAFEGETYLGKVRQIFTDLAKDLPYAHLIDGTKPIKSVHETIMNIVLANIADFVSNLDYEVIKNSMNKVPSPK